MLKGLIRALSGRGRPRPAPRRRARPGLESLGERVVPAVFHWAPQGASTDWHTASNWIVNYAYSSTTPTDEDYVLFRGSTSLFDPGELTFVAVNTDKDCNYDQDNGDMAWNVEIEDGYTRTVTITHDTTIYLDKLTIDSASALFRQSLGSTPGISIRELEFEAGALSWPSGGVSVTESFNFTAGDSGNAKLIDAYLVLGAGATGTVAVGTAANSNHLEIGEGRNIYNLGTIVHQAGEIVGTLDGENDVTNILYNGRTGGTAVYKKTTAATDARVQNISFRNESVVASSGGQLAVEAGRLRLSNLYQGQIARTDVHGGAELEVDGFMDLQSGFFYTIGAGTATLDCDDVIFGGTSAGALIPCTVSLNAGGTYGHLYHDGASLKFEDEAILECDIKGDGTNFDQVESSGQVTLQDDCELFIAVEGDEQADKIWEVIDADTLGGAFSVVHFPFGSFLDFVKVGGQLRIVS